MSTGRPRKVDRATGERITCIPRCCPRDLGWPFSVWSLSKLREVLLVKGIAEISRETLRQILKAERGVVAGHKDLESGDRSRVHRDDEPRPGPRRPPPTDGRWSAWTSSGAERTTLRWSWLVPKDAASGAYIRWYNQHARPKRDFAVNSKIRHPDYLPKVA
ncbi:hypothetical protein [Nocardia sp. CNY236]|uniref:hypothetical protein n=1 Tax=Nocardia sp. CNY236 TaxID=1169152 RepID=UPI00041F536B|nr:hypothetical protein [Nocardia sp. CNY236]